MLLASCLTVRAQDSLQLYRSGTLDCSINDVHTGYEGQMDAAGQVLGWLYYRMR